MVVRFVENLLEFSESVLSHFPEVGKGSGNPALKLADRWTSAVCLGKGDLTDEHLVRTDDGVVYALSVRRLAEHYWPGWQTSDSNAMGRSRKRRLCKVQAGSEGLLSRPRAYARDFRTDTIDTVSQNSIGCKFT